METFRGIFPTNFNLTIAWEKYNFSLSFAKVQGVLNDPAARSSVYVQNTTNNLENVATSNLVIISLKIK